MTKTERKKSADSRAQTIRAIHANWTKLDSQLSTTSKEFRLLEVNLRKEIITSNFWYDDPNKPLEHFVRESHRFNPSPAIAAEWDRRDALLRSIGEMEAARNEAKNALNAALREQKKMQESDLLGAYRSLIGRIVETILPICADEKEALEMAPIFPRAVALHERYWNVHRLADPSRVEEFAAEIETPIPEAA